MKANSLTKPQVIVIAIISFLALVLYFDWPGKFGSWHADHFGPPPVPVKFSVRDGFTGKVAVFENDYDKTLSVSVTFSNPTFKESKQYNLVIPPSENREIGRLEGWILVPGESIKLSSDGWRTRIIEYSE
jgi:hypothetical protein